MQVQSVVNGFARSAIRYDQHAEVQLQSAGRLIAYMEANTRDLVDGPLLEIGCGTGVLSKQMLDIFSDRDVQITDACEQMVVQCRSRLSAKPDATNRVELSVLDAQEYCSPDTFAMIAAAFTLQWIPDLDRSIQNLQRSLKPSGKLFFSLPTSSSFPEWKNICRAAGVPFTGNPLPEAAFFRDFAAKNGLKLSLYEETFKVSYRSLLHFLQSLKLLGAHTSEHIAPLSVGEVRRLVNYATREYPGNFPVTYKVLFGNFTKPE